MDSLIAHAIARLILQVLVEQLARLALAIRIVAAEARLCLRIRLLAALGEQIGQFERLGRFTGTIKAFKDYEHASFCLHFLIIWRGIYILLKNITSTDL